METYDRYSKFRMDGNIRPVPFIPIRKNDSDKYIEYDPSSNRLDLVSYQYYDDPNYGWLILQANPEVGSLEFNINRNRTLRVPYPLETAIIQYVKDIETYEMLYGEGLK